MTISAEIEPTPPQNLEALAAGRRELCERYADGALRSAITLHDRISEPHDPISRINYRGIPHSAAFMQTSDFVALQALGVDTDALVSLPKIEDGEDEDFVTVDVQGESLTVTRERYGAIAYTIDKDKGRNFDDQQPLEKIPQRIRERFLQSPAHRELHQLRTQFEDHGEWPEQITLPPFNPYEDPLGSLIFLEDQGLGGFLQASKDGKAMAAGATPESLLNELLEKPGYDQPHHIDQHGNTTINWGDTVKKSLTIDAETKLLTFSLQRNPEEFYPEKANQSSAESAPFVETQCAKELSRLLDSADLMFHPHIQKLIMEPREAERYGSIYTDLSREVAKWIDRPDRTQLSNLFVPRDPEYLGNALIDRERGGLDTKLFNYEYDEQPPDIETTVRQRFADIDHTAEGEAASVLVNMIDDVLHRDQKPKTDLPVTKEDVEIRYEACFDVVTYYVGAAHDTTWRQPDALKQIQVGQVGMLEKQHGAHTFLSTDPLVFNGVRLPKGSLFSKQPDGWAFLRLTPFAFDNPEDQLATGSEIAKTLENEKQALRQLGGLCLENLVV